MALATYPSPPNINQFFNFSISAELRLAKEKVDYYTTVEKIINAAITFFLILTVGAFFFCPLVDPFSIGLAVFFQAASNDVESKKESYQKMFFALQDVEKRIESISKNIFDKSLLTGLLTRLDHLNPEWLNGELVCTSLINDETGLTSDQVVQTAALYFYCKDQVDRAFEDDDKAKLASTLSLLKEILKNPFSPATPPPFSEWKIV